MRTQQRALVKCQIILVGLRTGENSFGSKTSPPGGWHFNEVSLIHFFGQFKLAAIHLFPVVVVFFFYGEFDPGSG